jgi:hypothetical protein
MHVTKWIANNVSSVRNKISSVLTEDVITFMMNGKDFVFYLQIKQFKCIYCVHNLLSTFSIVFLSPSSYRNRPVISYYLQSPAFTQFSYVFFSFLFIIVSRFIVVMEPCTRKNFTEPPMKPLLLRIIHSFHKICDCWGRHLVFETLLGMSRSAPISQI